MVESVIAEGVNVMIYGMGTVFSFLILLVFAIQLMTIVTGIFSDSEEASEHESIVQKAKLTQIRLKRYVKQLIFIKNQTVFPRY